MSKKDRGSRSRKRKAALVKRARRTKLNAAHDRLRASTRTALQHFQAGRLSAAEQICQQILQELPDHVEAVHLLGLIAHKSDRNDVAAKLITRAIELNGTVPEYHFNLGNVFRAQDKPEAVSCYERALTLNSGFVAAHINLGIALTDQRNPQAAVASFARALQFEPENALTHFHMGRTYELQGRMSEATTCYTRALEIRPDYVYALNNLGNVLQSQERLDDAAANYKRALRLNPDYATAHIHLGNVFRLQGHTSQAQSCFERALSLQPQNDGFKIKAALVVPVILESSDEMHRLRRRIQENIARLRSENLSITNPLTQIGQTAFHLAYHGMNDRDVQSDMAALYAEASPTLLFTAPHCRPSEQATGSRRPIKVGFISAYFYRHSVSRHYAGIIDNLSRDYFQVIVYRFPSRDAIAQSVNQRADSVVTLPLELDLARSRIAEGKLDVLFYTDIGMDPWTYFLAFSRLAPVQCVASGHPVTTGIPTIDYFISSELLEPEGADAHYTEQLVRLKAMSNFFDRPRLASPPKSRTDLGLDEEAHLYVCVQALFKIHPDFDKILGEILHADPHGRVVLFHGQSDHWTELLSQRLRQSIPEEWSRIQFLPGLRFNDYLHLLAISDVLLDTIHFGGGTTSFQALGIGTPVVTLPGQFMRGRSAYACYRKMGVWDCVANTPQEYVQIAVRLGTEPVWRENVKAKILAANHVLFGDIETVRELEQFFVAAVEKTSANRTETAA